jgi:hypothetical protein
MVKMAIGFLEHVNCSSPECLDVGEEYRQAWQKVGLEPMPLHKVVACLKAIREERYDFVTREAMLGNPVALAWLQCKGEAQYA